MVHPCRFVPSAPIVLAGCVVALLAAPALAQQAHPRVDPGASSAPHDAVPGHFHESGVAAGTSIGNGRAPTTASGPVGELRGNTAPPPGEITGPIGPSDVARLMQIQLPRLRPCYETARSTHPQLAGRVDVRFRIGRDGRVTEASASGLPDAPDVATCVAAVLRGTTFPVPQGGSLQFSYPLMFQPTPAIAHGHPSRPVRAPARRPSAHR